jgi:hypothetical protein
MVVSRSVLLFLSIGISVMLLTTIVFAVTVYSTPDSPKVKEVSLLCHDKILEYARFGAYTNAVTFNATIDSCNGILEYS